MPLVTPEGQDPAVLSPPDEGGHNGSTHTQTGSHGSHQHIPAFFHPSPGVRALCSVTFLLFVLFLLGCSRYVCSFQTPYICFLRSLSFCLSFVYRHQQKTNQPTGLQCGHQSELVLLEEVILCISYVGTIVVSKICHGHTNTHTHAPLSGRTETGASRISQ